MRVCVCVATYRRPEGLKRLLDGLNLLEFKKAGNTYDIRIIVIDNDSEGPAAAFCRQRSRDYKWRLEYYIEPRRGISYARNKAISCAGDDVDFVAFIDDDEVPEPAWLDELLYVQRECDADVVTGPVLPYFNSNAPSWVIGGNFFNEDRYPTGHVLNSAKTGNALIRFDIFKKMGRCFDERYALTGGEDSHLFRQLYRDGHKIVWADNAIVNEWVPESRTTAYWLLQRSFRNANIHGICELDLTSSYYLQAWRFIKGTLKIIQGLVYIIPSAILGRQALVKALQKIASGAGLMMSLFGMRYKEYGRIHGR